MPETKQRWTAADAGGQHGRTAVITGANTGIGFETAKALAAHGATTVLACRDARKAQDAAARITAAAPEADVRVVALDLGSLDSVRKAAEEIGAAHERIDLLVNNAGVMMPPYGTTADGFELQIGVNHLGHYALTGLLLPRMLGVPGSRVVTVSSNGHKAGRINFDDLQSQRRYRRMAGYAQSKLANLLFTYELARRLAAAGAPTVALAAHPGSTTSDLIRHMPGAVQAFYHGADRWLNQPASMGALPTLRAALDPGARNGEYYGPDGWMQFKGYPVLVSSTERSHSEQAQQRLWAESERLTGVAYPV